MKIKFSDFKKKIKKKLEFIYIIFNNEYILSKNIIKKIIFFYKKKNYKKKFSFIINKNFNWENFFSIYNVQSLFKEKKIIELIFIEKNISKIHLYKLYNLIFNINKNNLIIINFTKLTFKDKNSKYIKYLKKNFFYFKISKIKKKNIPIWIKNNFKNQKQIINNKTSKYFSKKINNNLLLADQEIKKFSLIYKTGKLSLKKIKKYITKNIFNINKLKFNKIFFSKNIIKIIKNIKILKKNNISILLILWNLLKEIRILIKYKTKKINSFFLDKKYKLIIKKITLYNLKLTILKIFNLEQIIKGIKNKNFFEDPWSTITIIIINLLK